MTDRVVATRYARALLDVSLADGDPERVERDLSAFAALLDEHSMLRSVLLNPAVTAARKRAVASEILDASGDVSVIARRLIVMLGERDRFGLLAELLEVFRERLMDHRGIVRARITTAAPVDDARTQAIRHALAAATGRQVTIEASVDPALVGGLVTQIGSTVYDGSVARHLEQLRRRFTTRA